jgi:hypothetical protein
MKQRVAQSTQSVKAIKMTFTTLKTTIFYLIIALLSGPLFANPPEKTPFNLKNFFIMPSKHPNSLAATAGQLTITGAGTIRFIQAFFYSDTGCSTLLGAASITDNSNGFPFTNGQTIRMNESAIYQLANNQNITTGDISCMRLFLNGSNQEPDGVSCQDFNDITCTGVTCTSNQTKTVSWVASPTKCINPFAYVTNGSDSTVLQCTIATSGGALSNCTSTGSDFSAPYGIAFNNNYAYIANNDVNEIMKCTLDASDGTFVADSCVDTGVTVDTPAGIALNTAYFYVVEGTVLKCTVNPSSGELTSCGTTASGVSDASTIAFNNGYAYLTNILVPSSTVYQCAVNASTGVLTDCTSTGSNFTFPNSIAINNGYAYVGNPTENSVTKCTIDTDGTFVTDSCASTGSSFSFPLGIAFNNGFAYIVNNPAATVNDTISKCTVGANGDLDPCAIDETGFSNPFAIAIF